MCQTVWIQIRAEVLSVPDDKSCALARKEFTPQKNDVGTHRKHLIETLPMTPTTNMSRDM